MSVSTLNLHYITKSHGLHKRPLSIVIPRNIFLPAITKRSTKFRTISYRFSHYYFKESTNRTSKPNRETRVGDDDFPKHFQIWNGHIRSVLPGGSWWKLGGEEDMEIAMANPVTVWSALRRMWGLIEDDRWIVYVAIFALIIAAVSEITMPSILAASIFSAQRGEMGAFNRNSRLLVILFLTSGVCSGLRSGLFGVANVILVKRLKDTLYSILIFQDISFFDKETTGGLTSRLGADCQKLSQCLGNDVHLILRNGLQGTGALINLLTLSWPLGLSALMICFILAAIFLVYGQYQKKAGKLTQEFNACANEVAQETISMMRTVQVYGTLEKEIERYKLWLRKLALISIRESVTYGLWNMSFHTLYRSMQVLAVLFGGMSLTSGLVSAEQLTKYVLYCEWLIYATWRIADNLSSLTVSIGASERAFQLMDLLPSDQFLSEGVKMQSLLGDINFVDISFQYPSRAPILDHLNFSVQANEVVAIVGPSGSGKSTLVSLLLRLYEPTDGQIYVDGIPLKDLDIGWLRDQIGFVEQEPHLFHADIKTNIRYGCRTDVTDEDIEWAAKQAYAHEFISSLTDGYETLVDDNLLSGGQKQRIAIARAILRDPAILILDEATSALDTECEHYVERIFHALRKDNKTKRTVITITHRVSSMKAVDRIIVMESGQIVEMGNHVELLLKRGLYSKLVRRQLESLA